MVYIIVRKVLFSVVVSILFCTLLKKKNLIANIISSFLFCSFFEIGAFWCRIMYKATTKNMIKTIFQNKIVMNILGGYATVNYVLLYFFVAGLIALIYYYFEKKSFKAIRLYFVLFAATFGLLVSAFSNRIEVTHYTVKVHNLPETLKGTTIVQVSDLHDTVYKNNQQSLIDKIQAEKPDLIFLTGDIVDDANDLNGTELLLEGIKDTAPLYYVPGNHEYWSDYYTDIIKGIQSYGVTVLEDDMNVISLKGQYVYIFGFDDPDNFMHKRQTQATENRFTALSAMANEENVNLLLSHRPELYYLYEASPFDVIFSGHAHGGQVRLPFTDISALAPNQGFFPEYTSGVYELTEKNALIISRGININERLPRVFNRPNLVVVTLE